MNGVRIDTVYLNFYESTSTTSAKSFEIVLSHSAKSPRLGSYLKVRGGCTKENLLRAWWGSRHFGVHGGATGETKRFSEGAYQMGLLGRYMQIKSWRNAM